METYVQYYDDDLKKLDLVSIGRISSDSIPNPPTDDWLPFQYEMDPGKDIKLLYNKSWLNPKS